MALRAAAAARRPLPAFPLSTAELRRLLDQYDPDGASTPAPDSDAFDVPAIADDPDDIIRWIETNYLIVSDAGLGLVPFTLYPYQKDFIRALEGHREVVCLKARQLGMTELLAAYLLYKLMHHSRWTAVILSKGEEEAKEFLAKMRIGYENLPQESIIPLKNPKITSVLLLANGSRAIPKATTSGSGRSYAAQLLVLDEWAWMERQDKVYAGAAPTARSAGNKIIGFSSANGDGNFFARMWHSAREAQQQGLFDGPHADEAGMFPIFLPWSVRPGRDEAWYRRASANMEDWQKAQEYPSTEDEAFILSGRPRFDVESLRAIRAGCRDPLHKDLDPKTGGLLVWEAPNPYKRYVIGADVAEGKINGDWSVGVVLDYDAGVEVAALRGHWEPAVFAGKLHELGYMYSTRQPDGSVLPAFLAVERNSSGGTVLAVIGGVQYAYPNLYYHTDYDAVQEGVRAGWQTSTKTKPIMIDALAVAILERRPFRWLTFVDEALRYVREDDGKTNASGEGHDDCVLAMAVCEMARRYRPSDRQVVSVAQELGIDPALSHPGTLDPYGENPFHPDVYGEGPFTGSIDSRY
jgi:hypothetical protein